MSESKPIILVVYEKDGKAAREIEKVILFGDDLDAAVEAFTGKYWGHSTLMGAEVYEKAEPHQMRLMEMDGAS